MVERLKSERQRKEREETRGATFKGSYPEAGAKTLDVPIVSFDEDTSGLEFEGRGREAVVYNDGSGSILKVVNFDLGEGGARVFPPGSV